MAVINDLPYEMLEEIVSYLPFPDLLSSSVVSKNFHAVCQPLLYKSCRVITNQFFPNGIKDFLCALVAHGNGSLANRVQSLTIVCEIGLSTGSLTQAQLVRISRAGVDVAHAGIYRMNTPQDTLLITLLHLLSRLQVLDIGKLQTHVRFHRLLLSHYPFNTTNLPVSLQSIREFRCERLLPNGGITVRTLLMLLDLPSLRTVKVHILEEALGDLIETPSTSNVTSLSVSYHMKLTWSLTRIFSRTKPLESFSYTITNSLVRSHSVRLGVDLEPHMNTLSYLSLNCFSLTDYSIVGGGTYTIGTLRNFPMLRTLITSLLPIVGTGMNQTRQRHLVDALPRGLMKLVILRDLYWSEADGMMALRDVLAEKQSAVPMLKEAGMIPVPGFMTPGRTFLTTLCAEANVTLATDTTAWRLGDISSG